MTEPKTWDELKRDPQYQRGRRVGRYVLLGLVAVALGAAGISALADDDPPVSEFGQDEARVMCEDFVRDRLKAPSTAGFDLSRIVAAGVNTWRVTGSVDAENSFGGTVRTDYQCTVRGEGGSATLVDLQHQQRD